LIVGSLAAISFARAASTKVWRVALITSSPGADILNMIRTSLKSAGYEEGNNLIIDFREANGHYGRLPGLVDELIAFRPDLIIAEATPAVAAAQKATTKIPIIMAPASDWFRKELHSPRRKYNWRCQHVWRHNYQDVGHHSVSVPGCEDDRRPDFQQPESSAFARPGSARGRINRHFG
jgi:hypothetical protein